MNAQIPKPTRRRSAESRQQLRAELLRQAREIFRTRGYEAVTVRAVTQALGLSPMAFYAYFPSRTALVEHIWIDIFRELLDALLAAGHGAHSPLEVLRAHAQANLDYWEGHEDHFRMVYLSGAELGASTSIGVREQSVYVRLLDLLRERVLACVGEPPLSEHDLQLRVDFARTKLFGYLFSVIGLGRYPFVDRAALKCLVIEDFVQTAGRAGS